jgi:hypothetical protein
LKPPPAAIAVPRPSTVSTITNAQQSDLLLAMHAIMLKDQKHEIKKKKRHELSKWTTANLQHRIDSICDSLDELSRRTLDSDLSSALSMISSKVQSDDSNSLNSKDCAAFEVAPARPTTILFSKAEFCTFDGNDPAPSDIHHGFDDPQPPTTVRPGAISDSAAGWVSPRKKQVSSLIQITPPPLIATANPFSPLHNDHHDNDSIGALSSLGHTRYPTKKPNKKKPRPSSPAVPVSDVVMYDPLPLPATCRPSKLNPNTDPTMIWEDTPDKIIDSNSFLDVSADNLL